MGLGYGSRMRAPVLPQYVVMTDRDDGIQWALVHDADRVYVGINDTILTIPGSSKEYQDVVRYTNPFDGPVLPGWPRVRLLIRGGRLGFEVLPDDNETVQQAPVLTRRLFQRFTFEIKMPAGETHFDETVDTLAYTDRAELP